MNQMKTQLLMMTLTLAIGQVIAQHHIIPVPVSYENQDEAFELNRQGVIDIMYGDKSLHLYAKQLQDLFSGAGEEVTVQQGETRKPGNRFVTLMLNPEADQVLGDEGYTLDVTRQSILISANQPAGIFNGIQTLRQLLPPDFKDESAGDGLAKIAGCSILDYPRFSWRGLMLDVSRHFFTVEEVKAFIDQMARYKYNVFHWHLTDDEGWRIEIKSLPKLTEVGAWRVERYGRFGEGRPYPEPGEKATYGGFYTHEQIREVVQYALERNITIVPEIDLPGHSMAALAAYPELSTRKEAKFVNPGSRFAEWYGDGTFKMLIENTLNPADEKVYEFVDKVFTEVASLFPGEYIHMGGDECYHGYWEEDKEVQKFMKKHGLKDSHELQSYFVKRVEEIISNKGKTMIGWDEIMEGGLAEGAAVMSWRGMEQGIEAARLGHEVVMTPVSYCYLDYTQGDHSVENPIYADLSLEKTYSFEPLPEGVDPDYILGGQGNLWTEVIPNLPFAFYMTYPRAFALSEVFWSPKEHRNWNDFMARTEAHIKRFDAAHTNISRAIYDPVVSVSREEDKLICELKNSVPGTEIYFTINNTYPAGFGTRYSGPFEIPEGNLSLRARTLREGKPLGRELVIPRQQLEQRARRR
jgi:hexosaminidase